MGSPGPKHRTTNKRTRRISRSCDLLAKTLKPKSVKLSVSAEVLTCDLVTVKSSDQIVARKLTGVDLARFVPRNIIMTGATSQRDDEATSPLLLSKPVLQSPTIVITRAETMANIDIHDMNSFTVQEEVELIGYKKSKLVMKKGRA